MKKTNKRYKKWVLIDIKHCPRKKRKIKKNSMLDINIRLCPKKKK